MSAERRPGTDPAPPGRRRLAIALAAFACACAFIVQSPGWAQTSYMALSKALTHGTAQIDQWHWETHDVAYTDGHYYSVKPPGLVFATLPLYTALDAAGAQRLAHDARVRAESDGGAPWAARTLPTAQYGFSRERAIAARTAIADDAPMTWALGLLGVLAPAVLLLAPRRARGGPPGARARGPPSRSRSAPCTLVLPFSTLYFSHILSALLGFAAFALVWRERDGALRPWFLALAGLLAGLAVVCEYPLAISAAIVGLYALKPSAARRSSGVRCAYGGGVAAGVAPLLAYQWWAFGSPLHLAYANAVAKTGHSGHDVLGLNAGGFFGITLPRPLDALELLFSGRGLLTLSPVLVLAAAGVIALRRSGRHRAEANVIVAIVLAYFIYNAGYWLPLGGGSPGPRFLIPILPFLGLGLAIAWQRWPAATLVARRDLGDDDGDGDDELSDAGDQRPGGMGAPVVRLRRLSAQPAGPRRRRPRARRDPAVRGRHRGRARRRGRHDRSSRARARRALGAGGRGRLGGLRDRPAAAPAPAVGRCAVAHRGRGALGLLVTALTVLPLRPIARALSAGRRARPRRCASARGSDLAASGLTRRRNGLSARRAVEVDADAAHAEAAQVGDRAGIRERLRHAHELVELARDEAPAAVDELREAVGGPQDVAAVVERSGRQVQRGLRRGALTGRRRRNRRVVRKAPALGEDREAHDAPRPPSPVGAP